MITYGRADASSVRPYHRLGYVAPLAQRVFDSALNPRHGECVVSMAVRDDFRFGV